MRAGASERASARPLPLPRPSTESGGGAGKPPATSCFIMSTIAEAIPPTELAAAKAQVDIAWARLLALRHNDAHRRRRDFARDRDDYDDAHRQWREARDRFDRVELAATDWGSKEQVLPIVAGNGEKLQHASAGLRNDAEIAEAAIASGSHCMPFVGSELKDDPTFMHPALCKSGHNLEYASPALQDDRETVLLALRSVGFALQYASPRLRADREMLLAALTKSTYNDYRALACTTPELRADLGVVGAAVATGPDVDGRRPLENASSRYVNPRWCTISFFSVAIVQW